MFQINQNNLHLLLPGKISWLVEYLHEDYGFTLQESLHRIYHSELWRKRSIPTHSEWLYPLTFDAGKGLKEA